MASRLKNTVRNKTPADLLNDEVDLTISKQVVINADIRFKRLVRIDGRFEGKLIPTAEASVIVTKRGHYLGDIIGLDLAYIDGTVEGNIAVNALELGPHANVCGNILCKRLVIAGHAKFTGEMNVSPSNLIPPPPVPVSSCVEPETDQNGEGRELHLVEDDETACREVTPKICEPTPEELPQPPTLPPRKTTAIFIHEPQVDLLADSGLWPEIEPSECAAEQHQAIERLSAWIEKEGSSIDHIIVLLDIHYKPGLNDSLFWRRNTENEHLQEEVIIHPEVGTVITIEDISQNIWIPVSDDNKIFVEEFLIDASKDDLAPSSIVIKPKHCQIGGTGASIVDALNKSLTSWEKLHKREVEYLVSNHRNTNKENAQSPSSSNWVYDRNQIDHVASRVDRIFLAGQVLGHCHPLHLITGLGAGIIDSLGLSDDKEISILTDALLLSGTTSNDREEMREEVIIAAQLHHLLVANTEEVSLT